MLSLHGGQGPGAVVAHPLTEPYGLPVSPLVLGYLAAAVVVVAVLAWPRGHRPGEERRSGIGDADGLASWAVPLTPARLVTRVAGVLLLLLAIAAGRLGTDNELENLAPALVVGAGWPLLVLASALLGPVWSWLDPWDTVARAMTAGSSAEPRPDGAAAPSVWPAVLLLLPWLWFAGAYPGTLDPRSVGLALGLYTLVTLAGCLALGRTRWLSSFEPVGILLGWLALLPTRRLRGWQPPAGANAFLGLLAGGTLFGAVRRSEIWGDLNTVDGAGLVATLGLLAMGTAGAALLVFASRATSRRADPANVTRAALPALAGIVLAVAMDQNRLTTSLQLLPGLLGDPLGLGWDVFGPAGAGLDPAPFGTVGLLAVQLALVVAGALAGVLSLARSGPRSGRLPLALSSAALSYVAVLALVTH